MKVSLSIDRELCKGCSYCITNCPKGILAIEPEFNSQGFYPACIKKAEECTGCAFCAITCPEIAIEIIRTDD